VRFRGRKRDWSCCMKDAAATGHGFTAS